MKRGSTLLEVLLALALLASLVVAITSWTTMTATYAVRLETALNQESSAEAFLRFVHDAIATGDFGSRPDAEEPPRVIIDDADGALIVHSRAQGIEAVLRFDHDSERRELLTNDQIIVGEVAEAAWIIDDERTTLIINLKLANGDALERRYVLP